MCEVKNSAIEFNNFYNGTLIILGDEANASGLIEKRTWREIENPVVYGNLSVSNFMAEFLDKIDSPESINDIIDYEEKPQYNNEHNRIIIRGSALNDNYSFFTIFDNQAKTYMKNLKFESSLYPRETGSNKIEITEDDSELPSHEKLILFYPFEKDLCPVVGDEFSEFINKNNNNKLLSNIINLFNESKEKTDELLSLIFGENGIINHIDNTLIDSTAGFDNLSDAELYYLRNQFSELSSSFYEVKNQDIESSYFDYFEYNTLDEAKLTKNINSIVSNLSALADNIANTFINSNFKVYLRDHLDLINEDISEVTVDDIETYINNQMINVNFIKSSANEITVILDKMLSYSSITTETIKNSLKMSYSPLETFPIYDSLNEEDILLSGLHFNPSYHVKLGGTDDSMIKDLFDIMFSDYVWTNLNEKYKTSNWSSRKGSTVCFWVKMDEKNINANTDFFTFKFNDERYFNLKSISLEHDSESDDKVFPDINDENINASERTKYKQFSNVFEDEKFAMVEMHFNKILDMDGEKFNIKILVWTDNTSPITYFDTTVDTLPELNDEIELHIGNHINGHIRNFMVFAGNLLETESRNIYNLGIVNDYDLPNEDRAKQMFKVIKNEASFIGMVGLYDVSNINIINCVMKYNGSYYSIKSNSSDSL